MPIANSGDPVWKKRPLGPAGTMQVTLELNEAGKVVSAKPKNPSNAPEHLVRLVQRTLILLRAGTYALSNTDSTSGTQTFRLEAVIDKVADALVDDRSRAGAYALGFEAPTRHKAGHATFTLRSGRRVTITIHLVK